MAQYGRNFYGASYYGTSGVFAGQFVTDKTALRTALTDVAPADGKLYIDIYTKLATVKYDYTNNIGATDDRKSKIFIFQGNWVDNATSMMTSDSSMLMQGMLTCSDMSFNFATRGNGAIVDILVTRYTNGIPGATATYTVNTSISNNYQLSDLQFGDYKVEIKYNVAALVGSVFEFKSIDVITTDISLELASTLQPIANNIWQPWTLLSAVRTYDTPNDIYKFSFETPNLNGILGYQAKIMMATSDSTTTPDIKNMDVHTLETNEYSDAGLWKMTVDFGAGIEDITSVEFETVGGQETVFELRSRSTSDTATETELIDDNISWSWWSAPYSNDTHRALLDIKAQPALKSGYVITPLIEPENLSHWISFIPTVLMTSKDPVSGATNRNTSVTVEFLDSNLNVIVVNKVKQSFKYYDTTLLEQGIKSITIPTRMKITMTRELGFPTPAIDSMYITAEAEYKEVIGFGPGKLEAYGSAVFGENTGIDTVYTDGLARTNAADTANFGLTIPEKDTLIGKVSIGHPECRIDNINMPGYPSDLLKIYWNSESSKQNKDNNVILSDVLSSDYIVVEVAADGSRIKKHIQYGSGITVKIDNPERSNFDKQTISNIFSPTLSPDKKYAYHLSNGFSDTTSNENVDIRWNLENGIPEVDRRNVVPFQGEQIDISIVQATTGGLVEWKSSEKILEGRVNINSTSTRKDSIIKLDSSYDLPDIPGDVIISQNPYQVDLLDGSIFCEGQIVHDGDMNDPNYKPRITMSINTDNNHYKITQEDKAKIVKSDTSEDYLPKQRTLEVLGIYQSTNQYAPTYVQDVHFVLVDGNKIDWSLAIDDTGLNEPTAGEDLYISYIYEELSEITIVAQCDYNRNDYDIMNVYRTAPKHYSGRCMYGIDYVSDINNINVLWPVIPNTVDKTTLQLRVVIKDNDYVIGYVKDNRVIVTLGDTNPRENWNPHIRDGFYYIGDKEHYLFTSPYVASLDGSTIPIASNIAYGDGINGQGLLIQEETTNLLNNSRLDITEDIEEIFMDGFER